MIIAAILYVFLGYKSIGYLKYHLMGVKFELTRDVGRFMWDRVIWGLILGWLTIPLMLIVWLFRLIFH